jgi:hypothetical protein
MTSSLDDRLFVPFQRARGRLLDHLDEAPEPELRGRSGGREEVEADLVLGNEDRAQMAKPFGRRTSIRDELGDVCASRRVHLDQVGGHDR